MSQETINKSLQKNLISPLTNDLLWSQFLHAFSYELENQRIKYESIKKNYDIYSNEKDGVVRISESFGYEPNLVINNTLNMARKETESIPYRIKKKTTYDGYNIILQQNGQYGEVFNYFYDNYKLVKAINYEKTMKNLKNSDHYSPFYNVVPIKNFSSTLDAKTIILDYLVNGHKDYDTDTIDHLMIYSLDQRFFNPCWRLDKQYTKIPTKHIGIEYYPRHYYCEYTTNLGVAIEDVDTYSAYLKMKEYYLPKSMKVIINNKELDLIITELNGKEYYTDSENILNADSYYDIEDGFISLKFDIIPDGHEIEISYNINLLISSDHLYCLEQGAEYNKRCPIIPHTGIFLTADIFQGQGADYTFENDGGYTVPDLKLKALTTSSYNREIIIFEKMILDNATDEEGQPSGKQNFMLDSTIKWFLDFEVTSSEQLTDKFKYISYGNGALPIINNQHSNIFDYSTLIFSYNLNTDDDCEFIYDASKNQINCEVVGNTIKVNAIIDKSLKFDGETYAKSLIQLSTTSNENYSFGVWFNANEESSTSTETIFDNFINISFDYENEKLIIDNIQIDCTRDEPHFLCMNINGTDSEINIYLDKELVHTSSFTLLSVSKLVYIGCDNNEENEFYGLIDNLWMVNKNLTQIEIDYIYDNKITVISHMGNRLGYYELSDEEIYTVENEYRIIQSYIKTMDVVHEISIINETSENYYTSQTNFHPIYIPYFTIKYENNSQEQITLYANEKGNFYRKIDENTYESITGNVNFETGIWYLTKDTIKSKSQQKLESPTSTLLPSAYRVEDKLNPSLPKWYESYDFDTCTPSSLIEADAINTKESTGYEKTVIYISSNDSSMQFIYCDNDDGVYYIRYGEPETTAHVIKEFQVNGDPYETKLFSEDDGKHIYLTLAQLIEGSSSLENEETRNEEVNNLKSFVDLGEFSSTTIYTTSKFSDVNNVSVFEAFYDVNCSINRQIRKWKDSSNNIGYTLGSIEGTRIYYTDLSFTSVKNLDNDTVDIIPFTPMQTVIKSEEVEFEDLTEQQIVEKFDTIYKIMYILSFSKPITTEYVEMVKNSITFSYWITINNVLTKFTAIINENGQINGEYIQSGNFDYATNILTVTFQTKIESDIIVSFSYYSSLDINTNKSLIINYKVDKSIKINEIGLEDENHELLAYMTFPDIEPNNIYNNVSTMFAINLQN